MAFKAFRWSEGQTVRSGVSSLERWETLGLGSWILDVIRATIVMVLQSKRYSKASIFSSVI